MVKYQNQITKLISDGKLNIGLILAVPRSCSTLLEASISMNPQIVATCHEPCDILRRSSACSEDAFKQIIKSLCNENQNSNLPISHVNTVMKDMSHRIGTGEMFRIFCELLKVPPIFLIRHPFLSMESRLKKVLLGFAMKTEVFLVSYLVEKYRVETTRAINSRTNGLLELQMTLLNQFANEFDSPSWIKLVEESCKKRDYRVFREILEIDKLFILSKSGWQDMVIQIGIFQSQLRDFLIIDSKDLLIEPEFTLREISRRWGMTYDSSMVDWGNRIKKFKTGQNKPYQRIWYDKILSSKGVLRSDKRPLELNFFPPNISSYLKHVALPYYVELQTNKNRLICPDKTENRVEGRYV